MKKDMMSDLNMSHGKMSDFISVSLFGFTLVMKLRNINFQRHLNTLIFFFFHKKMMSNLDMSYQTVSELA